MACGAGRVVHPRSLLLLLFFSAVEFEGEALGNRALCCFYLGPLVSCAEQNNGYNLEAAFLGDTVSFDKWCPLLHLVL